MKLRVFLPAVERPDPATPFAWMLLDARREALRHGTTPLSEAPRADEVEAVLPAERVLFARLRLPRVNATTIRELLPFAVEDRLLADPSHIHAVAGATNARGETVVAVVDREWLQRMLAALGEAGLRPRRAWCESALLAGGRGDWNVVCGEARGMLVDDEGVSATFDRAEALPLALRIALDESAGRGERPASVRVHAANGAPLPDLERWSAEAGIPFTAGGRWEAIAAGAPAKGAVDLLQGELAGGRRARASIPRAAVVLAAALAAVHLAFTAVDTWRLRLERDALEARREAIFREAFPDARVVVDPDLQMARNLAELRRSRGLAAGDEFLVQLTRAAREGRSPLKSLEYANGKVTAQ
jgi:general secretion pathway protein L